MAKMKIVFDGDNPVGIQAGDNFVITSGYFTITGCPFCGAERYNDYGAEVWRHRHDCINRNVQPHTLNE